MKMLRLLFLFLSILSLITSYSHFESLREVDQVIDDMERINQENGESLSGAISLTILYHMREDQFLQGGNWKALYYAMKALQYLEKSTDSSINRKALYHALFMHQNRLLILLGRYLDIVPSLESYYQEFRKLPNSLPQYRRLSTILMTKGDALLAAAKISEAKVEYLRAIDEYACNHEAYFKLAQAISMSKNDPEEDIQEEKDDDGDIIKNRRDRIDYAAVLKEKTEEAISKLLYDEKRRKVIFQDSFVGKLECDTGDSEVNNMDELFKHSTISNKYSTFSITLDAAVVSPLQHLRLVSATFHWTLFLLAETKKDYPLAWFHFSQMRFLERFRLLESTVYNVSSIIQRADYLRTHITPEYWPSRPSQWLGLTGEKLPVFIVGFFRSGSTLLETLLDQHPEVWGMGEQSVITYHIVQMQNELHPLASISDNAVYLQQMSEKLKTCGKEILKTMKRKYRDHIYGLSSMKDATLSTNYSILESPTYQDLHHLSSLPPPSPKQIKRIVDKMLFNYLNIPLIHLIFPEAIILHSVRDPLDTLLSCMKNRFGDHAAYTLEFRTLVIEYIAYLEVVGHMRYVLPMIPHKRIGHHKAMIDVRYEQLVANPKKVMNHIFTLLDLKPISDEQIDNFHLKDRLVRTASFLQVKQPIYENSIGNWRKYAKQLQQNLIPELRDALVRLKSAKLLPYLIDRPDSPRMNWELSATFNYTEMMEKMR